MDESSKGYGAIASAVVSMVGLLAALRPDWTHVVTLAAHSSDLATVVPVLLTGVGTVGAAVSHPPAWLRARVCRAWATLRSLATWGTK